MSAGEDARDRRYLVVSLILSTTGGFADAGSYVLAHSFTGHITGNSILLAVDLAQGRRADAVTCLLAVLAFLAGTAGAVRWPNRRDPSPVRRLTGPILAELLLTASGLCYLAAGLPAGRPVFVVSLCLALGLQNGALGKARSVSFHTTFITGLSTTLVSSLMAGQPGPKQALLPPIIGCFLAGGFAGAVTVQRVGAAGFLGVPVLLLLALAVAHGSDP